MKFTTNDLSILKSRELAIDSPDYPTHALHVYRLNEDVMLVITSC